MISLVFKYLLNHFQESFKILGNNSPFNLYFKIKLQNLISDNLSQPSIAKKPSAKKKNFDDAENIFTEKSLLFVPLKFHQAVAYKSSRARFSLPYFLHLNIAVMIDSGRWLNYPCGH